MELIHNLSLGFSTSTTLTNLLFSVLGVTLGTFVGVLPGLGAIATISILLPFVYYINDPTTSIIFLAGIYYGTQYGGSITAILLKMPGEASSVISMVDGNAMAKKGRAGAALTIAALASFFAGTAATVFIALLSEPISTIALKFGPREYATMMLMGLVLVAGISTMSLIKSLSMILLGVLLGLIGTDINSGIQRFTLGIPELYDGISFGVLAIGLFGLSEILWNIFHPIENNLNYSDVKSLHPNKKEIKEAAGATVRGTIVGSLMGILPGGGATISSFFSYALEKRISKNPEKFGNGAVEGLAAPEAANNAAAQTSFIPMLSLGIPTNPVLALIMASLIVNKIQPGPQVIGTNPELFWGFIVSMWIGNFFLLILNLPLVRIWIKFLLIPQKLLFLFVTIVALYGAYTITNSMFNVWLLIPFTALGYILRYLDFDPMPIALGFIVGPMLEEFLRRSLIISQGNWWTFFESPLSVVFIVISMIIVALNIILKFKK